MFDRSGDFSGSTWKVIPTNLEVSMFGCTIIFTWCMQYVVLTLLKHVHTPTLNFQRINKREICLQRPMYFAAAGSHIPWGGGLTLVLTWLMASGRGGGIHSGGGGVS